MRHSFSSQEGEMSRPKISGFALAGMQKQGNNNDKPLNGVKKQNSMDSAGSGGDGVSTPRARSPGQ